jgi:hypothetical protein
MTSRTARRIPRRGGRRGLRERFRTFRRALLGRAGRQIDWNINACISPLAVHRHLFPASPQPLRASTTTKRDAFVGPRRTRPHLPLPRQPLSADESPSRARVRVRSRGFAMQFHRIHICPPHEATRLRAGRGSPIPDPPFPQPHLRLCRRCSGGAFVRVRALKLGVHNLRPPAPRR